LFVFCSFVLHLLIALFLLLFALYLVFSHCVVIIYGGVLSLTLCYYCLMWFITLPYSYLLWSVTLCYCYLLWSIILRCYYLLWSCCLALLLLIVVHLCCLLLLLFVVMCHLCLALLLCHSTPFLGIHDLTLPCVATPCYGLSFFVLRYCYLLIEVMYCPPFLPCVCFRTWSTRCHIKKVR